MNTSRLDEEVTSSGMVRLALNFRTITEVTMWQMAKMKGLEIFSPKEWDVPDSNIEIILKKKNIIEKMNQGRSTIGSMGIEK